MLEQLGVSFLSRLLIDIWDRIQRRRTRGGIRVEAMWEHGPTSRELGFTEPAIKVNVMNESESPVNVRDIRLMFCGVYGAPVAPTAPPGRFHPELPVGLDSGTEKNWYTPAERLSELLCSLHRPPTTTVPTTRTVMLRARCVTGTGRVYKSSVFQFQL